MLPTLTPYQLCKHREALDEIYLEKQLVFLTQNKPEILHSIHKYRVKFFNSYRNQFATIDIVSRLLNVSKRTVRLLAVNKYISSLFFSSHSLFNLTDVHDFIKLLEQDKLGHYTKVKKWLIGCTVSPLLSAETAGSEGMKLNKNKTLSTFY